MNHFKQVAYSILNVVPALALYQSPLIVPYKSATKLTLNDGEMTLLHQLSAEDIPNFIHGVSRIYTMMETLKQTPEHWELYKVQFGMESVRGIRKILHESKDNPCQTQCHEDLGPHMPLIKAVLDLKEERGIEGRAFESKVNFILNQVVKQTVKMLHNRVPVIREVQALFFDQRATREVNLWRFMQGSIFRYSEFQRESIQKSCADIYPAIVQCIGTVIGEIVPLGDLVLKQQISELLTVIYDGEFRRKVVEAYSKTVLADSKKDAATEARLKAVFDVTVSPIFPAVLRKIFYSSLITQINKDVESDPNLSTKFKALFPLDKKFVHSFIDESGWLLFSIVQCHFDPERKDGFKDTMSLVRFCEEVVAESKWKTFPTTSICLGMAGVNLVLLPELNERLHQDALRFSKVRLGDKRYVKENKQLDVFETVVPKLRDYLELVKQGVENFDENVLEGRRFPEQQIRSLTELTQAVLDLFGYVETPVPTPHDLEAHQDVLKQLLPDINECLFLLSDIFKRIKSGGTRINRVYQFKIIYNQTYLLPKFVTSFDSSELKNKALTLTRDDLLARVRLKLAHFTEKAKAYKVREEQLAQQALNQTKSVEQLAAEIDSGGSAKTIGDANTKKTRNGGKKAAKKKKKKRVSQQPTQALADGPPESEAGGDAATEIEVAQGLMKSIQKRSPSPENHYFEIENDAYNYLDASKLFWEREQHNLYLKRKTWNPPPTPLSQLLFLEFRFFPNLFPGSSSSKIEVQPQTSDAFFIRHLCRYYYAREAIQLLQNHREIITNGKSDLQKGVCTYSLEKLSNALKMLGEARLETSALTKEQQKYCERFQSDILFRGLEDVSMLLNSAIKEKEAFVLSEKKEARKKGIEKKGQVPVKGPSRKALYRKKLEAQRVTLQNYVREIRGILISKINV